MKFIECHPGFAGYIQAGGVILTVAGAILGPLAKNAYDRWQVQRACKRNADQLARNFRPGIQLILERIDWRLNHLKAGPISDGTTTSTERFGIEIPGGADQDLIVDPPQLDLRRLGFLFGFIDRVKAYNLSVFNRPIKPGENDADSYRRFLIAQLEALSGECQAVLQAIDQ